MDDLIERNAVLETFAQMLDTSDYDVIARYYSEADADKAIQAFKDIPAVNRWISCSERLPMEGMDVLACNFDEFCIIAHYNGDCWEDDLGRIDDGITHWQELPAPPEGGA